MKKNIIKNKLLESKIILEKDLNLVKEHWEKAETVSLKDQNLQILERNAIISNLINIQPKTLSDIGCGDCEDTVFFSEFANRTFAFDYSDTMLKKAKKNIAKIKGNSKIRIGKLDLINDEISNKADVVISKRCLINLGNFENQKMALRKIHDTLNKNGIYLMLECSKDGLNNLNLLRALFGQNTIDEPFHNLYFNMAELLNYLKDLFFIKKIENFSTYYFLTRIYNKLLENEQISKYDEKAKKVQDKIDLFGSMQIGAQFLLVLKKIG